MRKAVWRTCSLSLADCYGSPRHGTTWDCCWSRYIVPCIASRSQLLVWTIWLSNCSYRPCRQELILNQDLTYKHQSLLQHVTNWYGLLTPMLVPWMMFANFTSNHDVSGFASLILLHLIARWMLKLWRLCQFDRSYWCRHLSPCLWHLQPPLIWRPQLMPWPLKNLQVLVVGDDMQKHIAAWEFLTLNLPSHFALNLTCPVVMVRYRAIRPQTTVPQMQHQRKDCPWPLHFHAMFSDFPKRVAYPRPFECPGGLAESFQAASPSGTLCSQSLWGELEGAPCFRYCPHCTDRSKVAQTLWHLIL